MVRHSRRTPLFLVDESGHSRCEQRRRLRARRRALSRAEQASAARAVARGATSLRRFQRARRIACYLAVQGELDCRPLMAVIRRRHKTCYLPVLVKWPRRALRFAALTPRTRLRGNRLGIQEPQVPTRQLRSGRHLDLVFAPLVAFDSDGNRVGMGGGFYDRTLAFLTRRQQWHRPAVVGLAYDFQRVSGIQGNRWDVMMNTIVTERALYHPSVLVPS